MMGGHGYPARLLAFMELRGLKRSPLRTRGSYVFGFQGTGNSGCTHSRPGVATPRFSNVV
jgi:hypothetical protein